VLPKLPQRSMFDSPLQPFLFLHNGKIEAPERKEKKIITTTPKSILQKQQKPTPNVGKPGPWFIIVDGLALGT